MLNFNKKHNQRKGRTFSGTQVHDGVKLVFWIHSETLTLNLQMVASSADPQLTHWLILYSGVLFPSTSMYLLLFFHLSGFVRVAHLKLSLLSAKIIIFLFCRNHCPLAIRYFHINSFSGSPRILFLLVIYWNLFKIVYIYGSIRFYISVSQPDVTGQYEFFYIHLCSTISVLSLFFTSASL